MKEVMYIDGTPLYDYSAKLLDWEPGAPALTNAILTGKNYALPSLLRSELAQKTLTAKFNVIAKNTAQAYQRATKLINRLNRTTELQMPDGFLYRSALSSVSAISYPAKWIAEFSVTFVSVQHGRYISIDVPTDSYPIYYDGTAPAGYRIEFVAPSAMQSIVVQGIQITSIPAGAEIMIDGIEKTITQNGANKFAECNLVDFPVFEPSDEPVLITASPFVPLRIGYYPTYI